LKQGLDFQALPFLGIARECEIIGEIEHIETIAIGGGIHDIIVVPESLFLFCHFERLS
jgi:hypothetical protein